MKKSRDKMRGGKGERDMKRRFEQDDKLTGGGRMVGAETFFGICAADGVADEDLEEDLVWTLLGWSPCVREEVAIEEDETATAVSRLPVERAGLEDDSGSICSPRRQYAAQISSNLFSWRDS